MTLPRFLLIGAMKAGSTALYRDLLTNPRIHFPLDKEPNNLLSDEVLSPRGRAAYEKLYRRARPDQMAGDASTEYSKRPDHPGVPERAKRVLGSDVRIVYLVREPVARIRSHHHHFVTSGACRTGIDEAVRTDPRYINWTRYAMQIEPWIETFGRDRVRIVRFEDFVADRQGVTAEVCEFLGVEPRPDLVRPDAVYNKSEGKAVARGPVKVLLVKNPIYRRLVRPLVPMGLREKVSNAILPKAPPRPAPPSVDTVRRIVEGVRDDVERLTVLMGRDEPPWDLDAAIVRAREGEADAARPRPSVA